MISVVGLLLFAIEYLQSLSFYPGSCAISKTYRQNSNFVLDLVHEHRYLSLEKAQGEILPERFEFLIIPQTNEHPLQAFPHHGVYFGQSIMLQQP